jgi:hypothetical protein
VIELFAKLGLGFLVIGFLVHWIGHLGCRGDNNSVWELFPSVSCASEEDVWAQWAQKVMLDLAEV